MLLNSIRIEPLTASLDAVVSLIEQVLPGWRHGYLPEPDGMIEGFVIGPSGPYVFGYSKAPARALLAALLRAKAAEVAG